MLPASAFILNMNWCDGQRDTLMVVRGLNTYARHFEVRKNTPCPSTHYTPVPDLCWPRVAVHLGELQLGNGACPRRKGRVSNDISKCLPVDSKTTLVYSDTATATQQSIAILLRERPPLGMVDKPLWFGSLKGLPLGVVADDPSVYVAPEIELFRPEHRHFDGAARGACYLTSSSSPNQFQDVALRPILPGGV